MPQTEKSLEGGRVPARRGTATVWDGSDTLYHLFNMMMMRVIGRSGATKMF
jgi:hypothetical protein